MNLPCFASTARAPNDLRVELVNQSLSSSLGKESRAPPDFVEYRIFNIGYSISEYPNSVIDYLDVAFIGRSALAFRIVSRMQGNPSPASLKSRRVLGFVRSSLFFFITLKPRVE